MKKLIGTQYKILDERSDMFGEIVTIEFIDYGYVIYLDEAGNEYQTAIHHVLYRIKEGLWEKV